MTDENPYLAPELELAATIPPDEVLGLDEESRYEYAGILKRVFAKAIDLILFGLCLQLATCACSYLFAHESLGSPVITHSSDFEEDGEITTYIEMTEVNLKPPLIFTFFTLIAFLLWTSLPEWISGQSLGKLLFRLQVVKMGPPTLPSLGKALSRNLCLIFDGFFFGIVGLIVMRSNPCNQRVGDMASGTLVVLKRSIPYPPLNTTITTVQGLMAGLLCIFVTSFALSLIVRLP